MLSQDSPRSVAVVLGAGMSQSGAPGRATVLRAEAAIKLAKNNADLLVILSGDGRIDRTSGGITEAEAMAQIFEENNIGPDRLLLEEESRDTIGNAVLVAARYLRNMKPGKLFLVTSPFHAERSKLSFAGVLDPAWDLEVVVSETAPTDAARWAMESGGVQWTKDFLVGIAPGDLTAVIERLLECKPFYAEIPRLANWPQTQISKTRAPDTVLMKSEVTTMCRADNRTTLEIPSKVRLPGTVVPKHYSLTLRPDLTAFTFTGDEVVDISVKQPVNEIVLNASELTISRAVVTDANGSRLNGKVTLDEANERAIIAFDGTIGVGDWSLAIGFAGILNNKLHGFYRSVYKDKAGKEHVIASTQFEPNDARRAFPCWDEPSFKATFGITLEVDEHLTAISNGPVIEEHSYKADSAPRNCWLPVALHGKKRVTFGTTPIMATYLVAFVVGEFEHTEPIVVNGTPIRIYHIPGKSDMTSFGLSMAAYSLDWLEKYTGIKYMGEKLDLIGIPDFAFGAMENLGCITFRETALLVNAKTATIAELSRVAEVVAHENVHQWFGDLVTMKWWNGLWLNEAFATFMATKIENEFRRQWDRWTAFAIDRAAAFRTDGLKSTRPIEAPVEHPAQALGMIDVITYRKGCSVLRQLEQYIGEEAFRKGIAAYLLKHAYGNAETTDLWDAIDSVTTLPARKIMDSWIFQPGYPVITVSESQISGTVTLTQSPFKYLSEAINPEQLWLAPVHLRFKTSDGVQEKWVLLDSREQTIYLGENLEWVVANAGGHCFHRTRYSTKLAAQLTSSSDANLSAIERFNLVNDAWACVQAGLQTTEEYLAIVKQSAGETDPNVWSIVSGSLSRMHGMLPTTHRAGFEQMVREIARPTLDRLGWSVSDTDTALDRQVRGTVIALLGVAGGDTAVQSKAKELFAAYAADKSSVPSDVVPAVVGLVAHSGGAAEYAEFHRLLQSTNVPQEQVRFLGALASFRDKELLEKTLKSTITDAVRTQDAPSLVVRLLGNEVSTEAAWAFIKENWDYMVANFPETGLISMMSGITALDEPEQEADVREFVASHPVKGGDKAIAQALEQLRIGVLFNQRETATLTALFAPPVPASPTTPAVDPAPPAQS